MTDPSDMSCQEQADYLRMEIINRFIKPMLGIGIENLFVCAAMAEDQDAADSERAGNRARCVGCWRPTAWLAI
jgi:hypothetical protein